MANILIPMPSREWIQEHAFKAYKALNLGKVDVEIIRSEDDAVVQVVLPEQVNDKGAVAVSVFRFKNGYGIAENMQKAFIQAAQQLEKKVAKQKAKYH